MTKEENLRRVKQASSTQLMAMVDSHDWGILKRGNTIELICDGKSKLIAVSGNPTKTALTALAFFCLENPKVKTNGAMPTEQPMNRNRLA